MTGWPQCGLTGAAIRYSLTHMHTKTQIRTAGRVNSTRLIAGCAGSARLLTNAIAAAVVLSMLSGGAYAQAPDETGQATSTEQARVPTSHANVHSGPSSGASVLVMVPEGTVLPVIGRRGEWVQVQLSAELRETGIVLRWYEGRHSFFNDGEIITIGDEESGWMHDSTVEIMPAQAQ